MIIIESVKEFFKTCPLIDGDKIRAEFLPAKPKEGYTIETLPATPVIKTYIDGSSERQFVFAFGSREYYGEDDLENIDNSGLYESLAEWMERQSNLGLPINLGDGKKAKDLQAITPGYIYNNDRDSARYQIQCRLIYFQEA